MISTLKVRRISLKHILWKVFIQINSNRYSKNLSLAQSFMAEHDCRLFRTTRNYAIHYHPQPAPLDTQYIAYLLLSALMAGL